ncbi:hypothetical protein HPB51_026890 [Rhipicephalus microplus]|uniref:Uncharacterized protein n=1 Tax=Rhipicephalus microplus TaxID=6941 RepID=A0A9J6D234_RHIMP|nr:hypothetical protein HPB51_026890 [Rhipicephalus microplus]
MEMTPERRQPGQVHNAWVLEGSDEDGLWLEQVKIDRTVLSQQPWIRMTDPEPTSTMDDVYVLFGVLLCNLHSEAGTIFNRDWFQNRVNEFVQLFPGFRCSQQFRCTASHKQTHSLHLENSGLSPQQRSSALS